MAAAVRALLRRRAEAAAPASLALLQPLFPGLLLKPTSVRSPLLGAAVAGLPDLRRSQSQLSSAPALPLLMRYYSSEPSKGYAPPPPPPPTNNSMERPRLELELEEDVEFLIGGPLENLVIHTGSLFEALNICKRANALLTEGRDTKTVAMFENGLEKAFEALADRDKALNDISGALGISNAVSKDIQQKHQMFHKKWIGDTKFTRQELIHVVVLFGTMKIMNKVNGVDLPISLLGQKVPNELSKVKGTTVAFGMCFALAVMINVIFFAYHPFLE